MAPYIYHVKNELEVFGEMKVGNMFRIEPLINEGFPEIEFWDNNWTIVTSDGNRSSSFKHTILITEEGCEVLTKRK